jgi:hypothetical protein
MRRADERAHLTDDGRNWRPRILETYQGKYYWNIPNFSVDFYPVGKHRPRTRKQLSAGSNNHKRATYFALKMALEHVKMTEAEISRMPGLN